MPRRHGTGTRSRSASRTLSSTLEFCTGSWLRFPTARSPHSPVSVGVACAAGPLTPSVIKSFGFDSLQTVLYNIPGYATAFAFIISSATIVLYVPKLRFPLALFFQLVTFIALLFIAVAPNAGKWARWGVWTAFSHVFPLGTFLVAWPMMSLNIAGRTKKTFFSSCCLVSYCVGNMVGTQIMRRE